MGRVIRGIVASAAAALLLVSPASAAAGLTEFSAGLTPDSRPTSIARGWDGNVWFTEAALDGRIGRITPSGAITEFSAGLTPGAGLAGIAPGPDGNVWFVEARRGAIGRITPDGAITEFVMGISSHSEPQDIATGPDGNLWFTERAGRIGRITPGGVVTEFSAGMPADARPQGIAEGPDGNLWFTDASDPARIGRITTTGVITLFDEGIPAGSAPYDIAAGADGNLWFTLPQLDRLGRISPDGQVTLFGGMRANAEPMGIALGPDGNVWFAERSGGRIGVATPDGAIGEYSAGLNGSDAPTGITAGPNGSVWFTEAGRPGAIGVLDAVGAPDSMVGLPARPGGSTAVTPATPEATGGDSAAATLEALEQLLGLDGESKGWHLPIQGKDFLVAKLDGDVRVRTPRSKRSHLLTQLRNIPVKSRIDSRGGTIAIITALPRKRYQLASFKDGRFDARQARRGNGVTELTLRGKTGCGGNGEPDAALVRALSSAASPKGRRLWAKDRHGRWRTHGRDSVATVRGTEWITEDRCDGTLTTVVEGAVKVRDRHTGRSVLVRAGHSYLARKR